MSSYLDEILGLKGKTAPPEKRTDGALISGDAVTGQSDVEDNTVAPCPAPIERPPTLGNQNAAARVVGDMHAGQPNVADNSKTPDVLPGREK